MSDWIERDEARVWHGFTQMAAFARNEPIVVERGEGRYLVDVDGKRYLDAISSLWVTTLGHRVPELDEALRSQIDKVAHSTLLGNSNVAAVELAEALSEVVPVDDPHFLFASDGAAAVEQALKIAFQYWVNQDVQGRTTYLAFGDAYHGDTIGSVSVGDGGFGTDLFAPLRFAVRRAPGYDVPDALDRAAEMIRDGADELAAVVVEPLVQGAAGMKMRAPEDFSVLMEACRETGVLLICDEVATGFGRTGALFASQPCGLSPDLMCIGKGLTGGYLPMSATVANRKVFDAFLGDDLGPKTLYHGHSYSGNALAAAVAKRHLELISEWDVLTNVKARSEEMHELMRTRVEPHPLVKEVRIQGLMCGIELEPGPRHGRKVSAACVRRGVLIRPLGDVVVVMPPLTITSEEITTIVDVLAEAIEELGK